MQERKKNMTQKIKNFAVTTSAATGALVASATPAFAQTTAGNLEVPPGFFGNFGDLFNRLLTFVLTIGALLVFMYLIWGGIEWITSGGDKGKTESARNKITAAVVGLIVLAAAFAILQIALSVLDLKPDQVFTNEILGG